MRACLLLALAAFTVGCNQGGRKVAVPEAPHAFDVQAAEADAMRYLGADTKVFAVCGSSVGSSLFLDDLEQGFVDDSIKDGIIIFASRGDGRPEVLSRDVFKKLIVASEDGAVIRRLGETDTDPQGVWSLEYPATGVVISYNLASDGSGGLVNLWTQNKPLVGTLPPRTSTFLSTCVRK